MVNELRALLRDNIASAPADDADLSTVLTRGRRARRRRRIGVVGGTAVAAVTATALVVPMLTGGSESPGFADRPPVPDAPTIGLVDAAPAVEGRDYDVLATYTNEDLNAGNGQYLDGVTDDGLILFTDGPHGIHNTVRRALMDPATEEKDWLPQPPGDADLQLWPIELGAEKLVFTGVTYDRGGSGALVAMVFDRGAGTWQRMEWPGLADVDGYRPGIVGPDGRLYLSVPATQGGPPPGGWPMGEGGEADDSDADGDSYDLWSVSLSDPDDVRDEHLRLGDLAFSGQQMVWTDRTNGDAGLVHVRDLSTGEERSFDPNSGEKCNLLTFGVSANRIVMGQYCGDYGDERDDRVQILDTDGQQVVTIQDTGIEGAVAASGDSRVVTLRSYDDETAGNYVYDLKANRLLRVSEGFSSWTPEGAVHGGLFQWNTPVNRNTGAKQWLAEWRG